MRELKIVSSFIFTTRWAILSESYRRVVKSQQQNIAYHSNISPPERENFHNKNYHKKRELN